MYCAPIKPPKSARSVRAQRHTDMPKAQKVGQAGKNSQQPTKKEPTKKIPTYFRKGKFCQGW